VGSKILLAVLVGSSRGIVYRYYRPINRVLGLALGVFAFLFLLDGFRRIGVW
jgi:hypothetical protein